ncbi:universal stress protein [Naasia sp. SYSU D00948]|uniref:universal stress protein n=1 Tax=Naasia sp. SYSU D00948 TaxID=2817379 RepID=UPI001B306CA0|nr:universal stress protein [Naasia sp. SYSU D00948]
MDDGTVTVGIDGSPASRVAVSWAVDRSRHVPTSLELVTVVPEAPFHAEFQATARRHHEAGLAEAVESARASAPGLPVTASLREGHVAAELVRASESTGLLVVGTDKSSHVRRLVYGTVPLRLAALSACPLVVVPRSWTPRQQRILLAVGDDEPAPAAVAFAAAEAQARGLPLDLVHVWGAAPAYPTPLYLADYPWQSAEEAARELIGRTLQQVRSAHPGLTVSAHLTEGPTIPRLIEAAETAQLLVVGRHGRGIFRDLLQLGSVAHDVLLNPPVPIAVVPGQRRPDRGGPFRHGEELPETTTAG